MQRMKRYPDSGNRGFTLIEILVVLVLMALILGISVVFFANGLPGAKQKAAAGEIVATLKYAKHLAVATNEKQILLFDLDAGSYGIKGRRMRMIPEKTKLAIYESDINAKLITEGQYSMSYDATGLSQWDRIKLTRGDRVIQIKADPIRTALIAGDNEDDRHE
jgi:general secretion pathway protein H